MESKGRRTIEEQREMILETFENGKGSIYITKNNDLFQPYFESKGYKVKEIKMSIPEEGVGVYKIKRKQI